MGDTARMLDEFHAALGDERGRGNTELRWRLHEEEDVELLDELTDKRLGIDVREPKADEDVDREKLARELADVVYVSYGTAHAFDIDLDVALVEIHRAAMSKLDPPCSSCGGSGEQRYFDSTYGHSGEPVEVVDDCPRCKGTGKGERKVREDGKILKPEGFVPPDMSEAVR